jgi:hypothetical protein
MFYVQQVKDLHQFLLQTIGYLFFLLYSHKSAKEIKKRYKMRKKNEIQKEQEYKLLLIDFFLLFLLTKQPCVLNIFCNQFKL